MSADTWCAHQNCCYVHTGVAARKDYLWDVLLSCSSWEWISTTKKFISFCKVKGSYHKFALNNFINSFIAWDLERMLHLFSIAQEKLQGCPYSRVERAIMQSLHFSASLIINFSLRYTNLSRRRKWKCFKFLGMLEATPIFCKGKKTSERKQSLEDSLEDNEI